MSPGNEFAAGLDLTDPDNLIKESAFMGIIDALASKSLVNVLAEPNLTAKSGEKAEFLVGESFLSQASMVIRLVLSSRALVWVFR